MQRGAAALAVCLWLTGCEAEDPCDDGYTYKQGACLLDPEMESKDAGAKPDAGDEPDAGAGDSGRECNEDQSKALGKSCMNDDGCNCAAPYCALQPGQTVGFCTVYCKPSPDDCPSGYRCFDLSALGVQGIEPFCVAK